LIVILNIYFFHSGGENTNYFNTVMKIFKKNFCSGKETRETEDEAAARWWRIPHFVRNDDEGYREIKTTRSEHNRPLRALSTL